MTRAFAPLVTSGLIAVALGVPEARMRPVPPPAVAASPQEAVERSQPQSTDSLRVPEALESLAAVVEREYFDPDMAARIARAVRARISQDRYRDVSTLDALARTLTQDLYELSRDKHLSVRVVEQALPARSERSVDPDRASGVHRTNAGVQRIEILPGNVGYLNLTSFYRLDEAREALSAAMALLQRADALILDMRENGGGSPDTVAFVAGYLFERPGLPLFDIRSRAGTTQEYRTPDPPLAGRNEARPLYVLTARRTFSAGEGLAFILHERRRAVIVGEQTAGAANPGRSYPVTARLEVTVPNGQVRSAVKRANWEGAGVAPDQSVPASEALREAHRLALRALIERTPAGPWQETLKRHLEALAPGTGGQGVSEGGREPAMGAAPFAPKALRRASPEPWRRRERGAGPLRAIVYGGRGEKSPGQTCSTRSFC